MKLTENLKKIDEAVKSLSNDAKNAAKETAKINKELYFDSSNVDLVVKRFDALKRELDTNTVKIQGLKEAQAQLNEERAKEKGDTDESKRNLADIEKLAANYASQLEKAEQNQRRLVELGKQQNKNEALIKAASEQINAKYATWIVLSQRLADFTNKIYNSLKKVVTESGQLGIELSSLSKRYGASVEDIQLWNRQLQLATGQSDLFTQSLSVMVKGMAQIAAGRGIAYEKTLKNIGVAYKDIAELSAGEQFATLIEGLANVENSSLRAGYAQQLFGESGQYVASALKDGIDGLEGYRKKAEAFGIVTNSDAEALAELSLKLEEAKSQMSIAKAELATALLPIIQVFADFVRDVLAPILKTGAEWFGALGKGGQVAVVGLGALLLILPKVITLIASLQIAFQAAAHGATVASVAMNVLSKSLGVISIIATAVSVIGMIAVAFKNQAKATDEASNALKEYKSQSQGITAMGSDYVTTAESYATSSRETYTQIDVDIHGEGDTAISDESAMKVAQLTAESMNKSLGELIK